MSNPEWYKLKPGDSIKLIEPLDNKKLKYNIGDIFLVSQVSSNTLGGRLICCKGQNSWGFAENGDSSKFIKV